MDGQLNKINELYQRIGLGEDGQPFDRPPKLYPPEKKMSSGYSGNSSTPPPFIKHEPYREV